MSQGVICGNIKMNAKYIYKYSEEINSKRIVAGKWIKKLYTFLINGLKNGAFFYDERKANRALDFISLFCRHHEGALGGQRIHLELWQQAMVSAIFGIVDTDGNRRFREVFAVMGRKNGKTLLAAAIAAYCLYADAEYGAREYFAAPKLEQSNLCYDALHQMILKEPELGQISKKRRSDIYVSASNSTAKPLAFSAKKSDGLNISLAVCDEVASWQGDQGLKFYEVLRSSFGARRQPLILNITTAGYVNDGIYDELYKRSTSVLNGNSEESRLLPFLYVIDDESKWDDKEELKKSNPNLGVSVSWDFYKEEIAIARNSLSKKAEFLTKYCNIKQSSSIAWLEYADVDAISSEEYTLEDFKHSYCVGGIDLSQTTDLTACCVVIERDGKLYTFCQFFMPANKVIYLQERDGMPYQNYIQQGLITVSGENYVNYKDCLMWFVTLVEQYEILPLVVGYDRYSAQYLVQDMTNYGFHMSDVFQGNNLSPVLHECEGLIKDKTLLIGKNNLLKAHFLNVAVKQDNETRKLRPVKIEEKLHIDGFVSVIDALTVRMHDYETIGEQLKNIE